MNLYDKSRRRPLIALGLTLLILLSIAAPKTAALQSWTAGLLSHIWTQAASEPSRSNDFVYQDLRLKNQLLENKLLEIQALYAWERDILKQALAALSPEAANDLSRHMSESTELLDLGLRSHPARVVYRSPTTWNSTFWIDLGNRHNKESGRTLVSKNSPVVLGDCAIGLVDLVAEARSRVRLLTDPEISVAVRALRENEKGTHFGAKGEIHGSTQVFWRRRGTTLIGEGFNYDYEDEYGGPRDLRSHPAILSLGDLLVTSGMDGVFPQGFKVGTVSKIQPLREGDYYYEIEAIPQVENLDEVTSVTVLPPIYGSM